MKQPLSVGIGRTDAMLLHQIADQSSHKAMRSTCWLCTILVVVRQEHAGAAAPSCFALYWQSALPECRKLLLSNKLHSHQS